jgi:flagellar motility protein MotE (MotC chaperone)
MRFRPAIPRTSLTILAILLAASGALRVGFGVGTALARAPEGTEAVGTAAQCTESPLAVVEALQERDGLLAQREAALEERLAALDLAETAIAARLRELEQAEANIKNLVAVSDGAAEEDLARLTAVYEAMKPAEAAALFSAMPSDFAAGFLGRMRPEAAAQVMAGMDPETAFAISATIAGRNAMAPTE